MVFNQESSYRLISANADDFDQEAIKALDSNFRFKVATSLLTAMAETQSVNHGFSQSHSTESWAKSAISKLKISKATEKNELRGLNEQFKTYLDNVKKLEALNRVLQADVEKAKLTANPKLFDKNGINITLGSIRSKLEEQSFACARLQSKIESNDILTAHINDRLKFFHLEAEIFKQKVHTLQTYLTEMASQKEFLRRNAKILEDEISSEQSRILANEKDLESILLKLQDGRNKNKKLELEIQTLLDEISFDKTIFNEEIANLRNKVSNGITLLGSDVSNFYKSELDVAIRQIRDDFQALNEYQLNEYRQLKESELQSNIRFVENERIKFSETISSQDLSLSVKELTLRLEENKAAVALYSSKNHELTKKFSFLEARIKDARSRIQAELSRKQAEFESIRLQNENIANEIEHWDRYIRTNLESEIQTYKSILNSQIKLLDKVASNYVLTQKVVEEIIKKPFIIKTTITENLSSPVLKETTSSPAFQLAPSNKYLSIPEVKASATKKEGISKQEKDRNEVIGVLRQVFEFFDADKTGRVNSNEFDRVLSKLNVKISREAYQKMLRDNDLDSKISIILNLKNFIF